MGRTRDSAHISSFHDRNPMNRVLEIHLWSRGRMGEIQLGNSKRELPVQLLTLRISEVEYKHCSLILSSWDTDELSF